MDIACYHLTVAVCADNAVSTLVCLLRGVDNGDIALVLRRRTSLVMDAHNAMLVACLLAWLQLALTAEVSESTVMASMHRLLKKTSRQNTERTMHHRVGLESSCVSTLYVQPSRLQAIVYTAESCCRRHTPTASPVSSDNNQHTATSASKSTLWTVALSTLTRHQELLWVYNQLRSR
jgi:hypothetical protein